MYVRHTSSVLFLLCNFISVSILIFSFLKSYASTDPQPVLGKTTNFVRAPHYSEVQVQQLAQKINLARSSNGLKPLQQSTQLDRAANARAEDMSLNGYYAHKSPDGKFFYDVMSNQGLQSRGYACENLNLAESSNADAYIASWMASQSHKDCLLDSRIAKAGYAVTKIKVSNGIAIDQYVVVAIYSQ